MTLFEPLTATFKVVTPLFLGDAEREATRLSLASLKGQLRWWWRALEWSGCLRDKGSERAALAELKDREERLFGVAGSDAKDRGQSRVLMRLADQPEPGTPLCPEHELRDGGGQLVGPGARYLGYGLMGAFGARQGRLDRSCFPAGGHFTVELRPRDIDDDTAWQGVVRAVRLLGLLGGLGARSRRGWGSLTLQSLDGDPGWRTPLDISGYRKMLEETLRGVTLAPSLPPLTAFSALSRIEVVHTGGDPLRVLDHVGRQMQRYRAWGFRGTVNGEPSERNFVRDHDWSKAPWDRDFAGYVPKRAAFGLPHNYGKGLGAAPAAKEAGDRRASPLLIHVHALGEGRHAAVLAVMPARFVPAELVKLTWPRQTQPVTARLPTDWAQVLHGFLDGPPRARERGLSPYFPDRTPVLRPSVGGRQ
jgi:CRISPR-associated protein Cmr1